MAERFDGAFRENAIDQVVPRFGGISAFLSVRGSNISKQNRCWREEPFSYGSISARQDLYFITPAAKNGN